MTTTGMTAQIRHPKGNIASFRKEFKKKVLDNFIHYSLPVISLNKETPKEAVCTVFEKVNTGGVNLNTFRISDSCIRS